MAVRPKPPVALIAGPTASGKSAVALELAKSHDGVIVNADSAQVYRDIPVLSAAPTDDERAEADHRLYGEWDGATACSAADWAAAARAVIAAIHSEGRLPILVGGTGLYLRTLIDGIAPVPDIDPAVRDEVRSTDVTINRQRLEQRDPEAAARLGPADSARIARALEVVLSTGRSLRAWQAEKTGGIGAEIDLRPLVLLPPRDWLYARCDARFEAMVEGGAVDEIRRLLDRQLPSSLTVMRAIGVREIAGYLVGTLSLDEAIAAAKQATRNYAKRQYTWFAHQPPAEWPRFTQPLSDRAELAEALSFFAR